LSDSGSCLYSLDAIATWGLHCGRISMNVPISSEELSGVNYVPLGGNVLIVANNTNL
jgi:hypothetical protein